MSDAQIQREILRDGTIRLRSNDCAFLFSRLRPAAMLVTVLGEDGGEFGSAVLDEIAAEMHRFGRPLELFVDAIGAVGVAQSVSALWTQWFETHRARLASVTILARSRAMHLTLGIAKLLSRTGELIRVTSDVRRFEAAVARVAPEADEVSARARFLEPAVPIVRENVDGAVFRLRAPNGALTLRRLRSNVMLVEIEGTDEGHFGDAPRDEIDAEARRAGQPVDLYIDVSRCTAVTPCVRDSWTDWLRADPRRVRRATMLVGSPVLGVTVALAREVSHTRDLITIHANRAAFDAAIARAVPGWLPATG